MPPQAKAWLKANPQYVFDPNEDARIGAMHGVVVAEGFEPYSQEYFSELEQRLNGVSPPPPPPRQDYDYDLPQRRVSVSAPPSRGDTVVSNYLHGDSMGRITLTAEQKSAARYSGISEAEYSRQLMRLRDEKANGNYGGPS